jgi:hypothetical protein
MAISPLVQPTAVFWSVVRREAIPQPVARLCAEAVDEGLAGMRTQVVHNQMDGIGFRVIHNSAQPVIGKLGGGTVARHLGENAAPPWAGRRRKGWPLLRYSASRRATRPGCINSGGRTSSCKTTGFSSIHTTGSRTDSGFSYTAYTSSMRAMYSSSSSATHHIFFPPRLWVVAFEQDSDRFSSHPRHQLALYCFLR